MTAGAKLSNWPATGIAEFAGLPVERTTVKIATHVEAGIDSFWTRVRFSPPPPAPICTTTTNDIQQDTKTSSKPRVSGLFSFVAKVPTYNHIQRYAIKYKSRVWQNVWQFSMNLNKKFIESTRINCPGLYLRVRRNGKSRSWIFKRQGASLNIFQKFSDKTDFLQTSAFIGQIFLFLDASILINLPIVRSGLKSGLKRVLKVECLL